MEKLLKNVINDSKGFFDVTLTYYSIVFYYIFSNHFHLTTNDDGYEIFRAMLRKTETWRRITLYSLEIIYTIRNFKRLSLSYLLKEHAFRIIELYP